MQQIEGLIFAEQCWLGVGQRVFASVSSFLDVGSRRKVSFLPTLQEYKNEHARLKPVQVVLVSSFSGMMIGARGGKGNKNKERVVVIFRSFDNNNI